MYEREKLIEMIGLFGAASDNMLDGKYRTRCEEFAQTEPALEEAVRFLRDLIDECVFTAGASGGFLRFLSAILSTYPPETETEKKLRRDALSVKVGYSTV